MADKDDDDPSLTPEAVAELRKKFDVRMDPEALRHFMLFAEQLEKPLRMRVTIMLLLVSARHNDVSVLPEQQFCELMRLAIKCYAWATRLETIATLREHVVQHGELDFDNVASDASKNFDTCMVELGRYIEFCSEPTDKERAKPQ